MITIQYGVKKCHDILDSWLSVQKTVSSFSGSPGYASWLQVILGHNVYNIVRTIANVQCNRTKYQIANILVKTINVVVFK
jgi:hypothetical protein